MIGTQLTNRQKICTQFFILFFYPFSFLFVDFSPIFFYIKFSYLDTWADEDFFFQFDDIRTNLNLSACGHERKENKHEEIIIII